jgi:hypothetical protein
MVGHNGHPDRRVVWRGADDHLKPRIGKPHNPFVVGVIHQMGVCKALEHAWTGSGFVADNRDRIARVGAAIDDLV